MAYTCGFQWTPEVVRELKNLKINGLSDVEIATRFAEKYQEVFTPKMIHSARERYGIQNKYIELDKKITIYKAKIIQPDDYMISCDHHSPYFSEIWENRLLGIADRFGIKKHIIIGDLFDMDFIKWHTDLDGVEKSTLDKEVFYADPLIRALDYFDENYLITGNHERRVNLSIEGKIQARHLFGLFGKNIWDKKFRYSIYDKMFIGDNWMVVHPKSYSQISTSVAKRLAEKYKKNIINSHGHFVGMTYERSGTNLAIDLGGMFDIRKIDYINLRTTTHPFWKNGFGMLRSGKFWHFTDETDWDYWL